MTDQVPALVQLDRDDAADMLATQVEALLSRFSEGLVLFAPVRAALADYRKATS